MENMNNSEMPAVIQGPRRGERKAAETRRKVVDRLALRIGQGDDLQDTSLERLICGTRGVADGTMDPDTMYRKLREAGEKPRKGEGLKPGSLFARMLQEDDPASYGHWLELLAERDGLPTDMADLSFKQIQQQIGPYPPLSSASTTSSDLERYERKLASLARYAPDMFLFPGDGDADIEVATLWSARYLETARHLTLLAGRARDSKPDWERAAKTAEAALGIFFHAVAASAHEGQLKRHQSELAPDQLVLLGPLMPYDQVRSLAGEWTYAMVRAGMQPHRAADTVRAVSSHFPVMPPGDLETWAALARLDDPARDPIKELRWVPGYRQQFALPPQERRDPLDTVPPSAWEARALCRCWAAARDRVGDRADQQVQRLRELALQKLPPGELWRYTLTGQYSDKPGMHWLLERAADAVSDGLRLIEPPNDDYSSNDVDIEDEVDVEDRQLRPELLLGFDMAPQLPAMLLNDLLDVDARVRASLVILYDTLKSLREGFAWSVLPAPTRAAWGKALHDRRLKAAVGSKPIPEVAALTSGVRRLRNAMAARTAPINGVSLSALERTAGDLRSIVGDVLPDDQGPWYSAGELVGTQAAGVLFLEPMVDTSELTAIGSVVVELPGRKVALETLKSALAQAVKAVGGTIVTEFSHVEVESGTAVRWRAEGIALASSPRIATVTPIFQE